jgi:hypothetical protein
MKLKRINKLCVKLEEKYKDKGIIAELLGCSIRQYYYYRKGKKLAPESLYLYIKDYLLT